MFRQRYVVATNLIPRRSLARVAQRRSLVTVSTRRTRSFRATKFHHLRPQCATFFSLKPRADLVALCRTSSQKPADDLLANFRQQFPEVAAATSTSAVAGPARTTTAPEVDIIAVTTQDSYVFSSLTCSFAGTILFCAAFPLPPAWMSYCQHEDHLRRARVLAPCPEVYFTWTFCLLSCQAAV